MMSFIRSRAKLNSFNMFNWEQEIQKVKSVKRNVLEKDLCFKDFENCLLSKNPRYLKQNLFRTKNMILLQQNKT